jgi:hypothetical protein
MECWDAFPDLRSPQKVTKSRLFLLRSLTLLVVIPGSLLLADRRRLPFCSLLFALLMNL